MLASVLSGADRKNWFRLVEGIGVSGCGSAARALPFEDFERTGVSSLLVVIASDGLGVDNIFLTCAEFKRGLGLGDIETSLSGVSEIGKGSTFSEIGALPTSGFDPAFGIGAIPIKFVWD